MADWTWEFYGHNNRQMPDAVIGAAYTMYHESCRLHVPSNLIFEPHVHSFLCTGHCRQAIVTIGVSDNGAKLKRCWQESGKKTMEICVAHAWLTGRGL